LTLIQKEVYLRTRRKIPAESATFLGAIGNFLGSFILFLEEQSSAFSRTFTRFFSAERFSQHFQKREALRKYVFFWKGKHNSDPI